MKFTKDMVIGEVLKMHPNVPSVLTECGMFCLGCPSSLDETLADACLIHGLDIEPIIERLNLMTEGEEYNA